MSSPTRVAIVGGARTPFVKSVGVFKNHSALDLAVHSVNGLLDTQELPPESVDELVYGIVVVEPRLPHFAREVVFSSRLEPAVRALTIADNCITGCSAMCIIHDSIVAGRAETGIAGGVESMSNPPVMFSRRARRVFVDMGSAKSVGERLKLLSRLRPRDFKPEAPGIAEPSTGLSMGEHTELMVKQWKVSREAQDAIAHRSHVNAHQATEDGRLKSEIYPLGGVDHDLIVRSDTSMERLAKLRPAFDRSAAGTVTAGNASPLTDGAASLLLMSEVRAKQEGREPLAFIKAFEFVGIDPKDGLLMGPGIAVPRVLRKAELALSDIDIVEIHEAFAGQVECNLRAWEEGWKEPVIGRVDRERLNPLGGSIAIGHPFAATGIRIALSLAAELKRRGGRYGLISICGAGATAAAMILERA